MQDLKLVLSKYIVRRRLEAGEFSYVYRPSNQSVSGKKTILALLKADQHHYSKLASECNKSAGDAAFESELLKVIPQLPFESDPSTVRLESPTSEPMDEDNDDGAGSKSLSVSDEEAKRTVGVSFFVKGDNKVTADEVEALEYQAMGCFLPTTYRPPIPTSYFPALRFVGNFSEFSSFHSH